MRYRLFFAAAAFLAVAGAIVVVALPRGAKTPAGLEAKALPQAAPAEALTEQFVIDIHKRGQPAGQVIAFLPELHNAQEAERVIALIGEIDRVAPVDLLAVENYIAAPGDPAWDRELQPLADALKKPVKELYRPFGERYDRLFTDRWKCFGLEKGRPSLFIDVALLMEVCQRTLGYKKAFRAGFEVSADVERLVVIVEYLRKRYELPEVPETIRKRLTVGEADLPYVDRLLAAAAERLPKATQEDRNRSMAETLVQTLDQERPKLLVVVIGRGHVSREGMPEVLRAMPLLTELLADRIPETAWLISVQRKR